MRVFLLGFESSHIYQNPTAPKLAKQSDFLFRRRLSRKEDNYSKEDVLIRWGDVTYPSYDKYFGKVFNTSRAIKRNCNKLRSLMILSKANIPVPKGWIKESEIEYPALRRKEYHSRGRDIRFMKDRREFVNGDFYTQFIPSTREYKCHIFMSNDGTPECIRLSLKIPDPNESKPHSFIRSYGKGWLLTDYYEHIPKIERQIIEVAKRAVQVLDLDFGSCDVITEEGTNLLHVLEVNTCPRLNRYGRQIYSKEFREYLDLPLEEINLKAVKKWEFYNVIPIKYRHCYTSSKDKKLNEEGLCH